MTTTRHALATTVAVAAVLVTAACGTEDPKSSDGPKGLLTAQQVGDVTGAADASPEMYTPTPCGPDNAHLWDGVEGHAVSYARSDARVTVGHWIRPDVFDAGMADLRQAIASQNCSEGATTPPNERWTTAPMSGLPRGFVGFTVTVTGQVSEKEKGTRVYSRAYGARDGKAVLVWVDGKTNKKPAPDLVRTLLDKQLAES